MPKIPATVSTSFDVSTSLEATYAAFADPEIVRLNVVGLERYEIEENGDARWLLEERAEKGMRFRGDYTVRYSGNGVDRVTWFSVAGNIDIKGEAVLTRLPDGVRVDYRETLAPDLPIPGFMAKVFKPIVSREVRKDILTYLDNVKRHLSSGS